MSWRLALHIIGKPWLTVVVDHSKETCDLECKPEHRGVQWEAEGEQEYEHGTSEFYVDKIREER